MQQKQHWMDYKMEHSTIENHAIITSASQSPSFWTDNKTPFWIISKYAFVLEIKNYISLKWKEMKEKSN